MFTIYSHIFSKLNAQLKTLEISEIKVTLVCLV